MTELIKIYDGENATQYAVLEPNNNTGEVVVTFYDFETDEVTNECEFNISNMTQFTQDMYECLVLNERLDTYKRFQLLILVINDDLDNNITWIW